MGIIDEVKKINKISLGLVILLSQLFLFVNVSAFFPESMVAGMEKLIATYLILYAVMFAIPDLRLRIFDYKASQLKYYIMSFLLSTLVFSLLANFFIGGRQEPLSIFTAVSTVAISMIIVHSIIVAFIEEYFFRDYIYSKIGALWSSVMFGLFHYSVYNYSILAIAWASFLGYFFLVIKRRYSPKTNLVNIAVHASYNVVVIGVINVFAGNIIPLGG